MMRWSLLGATWVYGMDHEMKQLMRRYAVAFRTYLVNGEEAYLLEINPRPGATLDIFDSEADPLLRIHLAALLERRLPDRPLKLSEASAAAIVYATEPMTVSQSMIWPEWTADRPNCGDCIDRNRPICTVSARARTKVEAKQLVSERISTILAACAGQEGGTEWT